MKKNCGRPEFLEKLQAVRSFSKFSLRFDKTPNSLRQILSTFLEICFSCVLQKSPPLAVGKD